MSIDFLPILYYNTHKGDKNMSTNNDEVINDTIDEPESTAVTQETVDSIQAIYADTKHYYLDKNGNVHYCFNKDLQEIRERQQIAAEISDKISDKLVWLLTGSMLFGGLTLGSLANNIINYSDIGLAFTLGSFACFSTSYLLYRKYTKASNACAEFMEENDEHYKELIEKERDKETNGHFYH